MSRPERRRIHLWLIELVAGLVIGYVVIAGPVVYTAARGWLPDVVCQTFCIPLFALFRTPAWGAVGGYLEWWWLLAGRPTSTLAYDNDLRIAIAAFAVVAATTLVYWGRTRPELRPGRCAGCGMTIQVRSFRISPRACPPACPKCPDVQH